MDREASADGAARLVIAAGARAAEAALLERVAAHLARVREDPRLLARPLRIVVPSRALRVHVASRVVAAHGSVAGVAVQTLRGLTLELLARGGRPLRDGAPLFAIRVRQLARSEEALRRPLDTLREGYAVAAQTIADLLDAGLEPAHAEALEEWLGSEVDPEEAERARALLRVALALPAALARDGLVHRSALFREAREVLERHPHTLPAAGVLVHGYADATGVQADLLEALLRVHGGAALLDAPPDPAGSESPTPGLRFAERLRARFASCTRALEQRPAERRPALHAFSAPGAQVEAREVAERVAEALEAGVAPERIGIVARDLDEYADALETHFDRLGVPFHAGPSVPLRLGPDAWPARAVLSVLGETDAVAADRWLDAWRGVGPLIERDLRLAFHALGAARLRHVAALDLDSVGFERDRLPLCVRRGLTGAEAEDEAESDGDDETDGAAARDFTAPSPLRAPRRHLPREVLERAVASARATCEALASWPAQDTLARHLERLRVLLRGPLGWQGRRRGETLLFERLERLEEEVGGATRLERDELDALLDRSLRDLGRAARGSAGAGVRVATVMETRGLTFERLFVLGLNRDRFPRPVSPDPLLRDTVRGRLETLLPDVPVKARAFDEDRYLFASLCGAAAEVTLSWQAVSDDGRERPPSPLVERLRIEAALEPGAVVPSLYGGGRRRPRPAFEHAIEAGLEGCGAGAGPVLAAAHQARGPEAAGDAEAVARARLRTLAELESRQDTLGPFLGCVGRGALPMQAPFVTQLENLARCPWRMFLERVLRLEPLPDARTELPGFDTRLVGDVVHAVLERVVAAAGVPAHGALDAEAPAREVPWPAADLFERMLEEASVDTARRRGASFPGFERGLAARARPYLQVARELEWSQGPLRGVVAAEVEGVAEVETERGRRLVRFRADRVDREDGVLRLLDYKTGRPPGTRKDLHEGWLREVERGLWLQGVAYSHAAVATDSVRGGYVFCRPDGKGDPPGRLETRADDAELDAAFAASAGVLFAAAESGVLAPRLVGEDGATPRACTAWCQVREACLQHDTIARWRLRRVRMGSPPAAGPERLARRLLAMGPKE